MTRFKTERLAERLEDARAKLHATVVEGDRDPHAATRTAARATPTLGNTRISTILPSSSVHSRPRSMIAATSPDSRQRSVSLVNAARYRRTTSALLTALRYPSPGS